MRKYFGLILTVLWTMSFAGCQLLNPPGQRGQSALDDFIYALRWQQYNAAARFMKPEFRRGFLEALANNRDLTIVDVRLLEATVSAEGRRTDTVIEMDYYLLPSMSLETFRFEQTWSYFERTGTGPDYYQIITPFPAFP